ncbi:MAG: GAF domain-containing protein [Bacteroidales bacterium]|nr:GAF domain-containing protein [Bacteroidales bacterium]
MKSNKKTIGRHFFNLIFVSLFIFLLSSILIILIVRNYYSYEKSRVDAIAITSKMDKLQVLQAEFLLNADKDIKLFLKGETNYLEIYQKEYQDITESLSVFSSRYLKKSDTLAEEIILDLTKNKDIFQGVIYAYKQIGNIDFGLISDWIETGDKLENQIINIQNEKLILEFSKIRILENKFLVHGQTSIMEDISDQLNNLQYSLSNINSDDFSSIELNENIYLYTNIGQQLTDLYNKLGRNTIDGDLAALELSDSKLLEASDNLLAVVENQKISRRNFAAIGLIIVFVIICFLVIGYFRSVRTVFVEPVKFLLKYISNISLGIIDDKIELNKSTIEYDTIADSINILSEGLQEKNLFTQKLVEDDVNAELKVNEEDQLGINLLKLKDKINITLKEHVEYSKENEIRRYINEGIAKFSEIINNNSNNIQQLTDVFIRELVKYTESVQGGLYLINEDQNNTLELKAAFAYNRKKYITKSIMFGEGLVGTCAIEKKIIKIEDVPPEYIIITSGLGDAPPNHLLLVPMLEDEQVLGVLEIASLKAFTDFQLNLVQQVANSMASSIKISQNNTKTSELLEKTQRQAAVMQEQEEEMRQNMEELQATQEDSTRREDEMAITIDAVNSVAHVMEYDLEGKIIKANQKFLKLLGKNQEEIKGKKHSDLTTSGSFEKFESSVLKKLKSGSDVSIIEEFKIKNKKIFLKEYFTIIKEKSGRESRIFNLATDITENIQN